MNADGPRVHEGLPGPASTVLAAWHRWHASPAGRHWHRARELGLVTHTLALAAQQILCTAPLMVALSAVIRRAGGSGPGTVVPRYLGLTGDAARDVEQLFAGASPSASLDSLLVGAALSLIFGTGVALTFQRGLELIWGLPPGGVRSLGRQALWLVGLVTYLFVILGAGRSAHRIHAHDHAGLLARVVVQLIASFGFFWWSQHLLLGARVPWRRLRPGAMFIAAALAILVAVSGLVLPGQITDEVGDYGLIGAAFVLTIWLVALSGAVIGGAFIGAAIATTERVAPPVASP